MNQERGGLLTDDILNMLTTKPIPSTIDCKEDTFCLRKINGPRSKSRRSTSFGLVKYIQMFLDTPAWLSFPLVRQHEAVLVLFLMIDVWHFLARPMHLESSTRGLTSLIQVFATGRQTASKSTACFGKQKAPRCWKQGIYAILRSFEIAKPNNPLKLARVPLQAFDSLWDKSRRQASFSA